MQRTVTFYAESGIICDTSNIACSRPANCPARHVSAPAGHPYFVGMRLLWHNLLKTFSYRHGTAEQRRLIEIRFSVAKAVRHKRRELLLTQTELAARLGMDQSTVSDIERGDPHVSLERAVWALLHMAASDEEIATAFNAGARSEIQKLRQRAELPFYPLPRPSRPSDRRSVAPRINLPGPVQ